jgi:hypothetical protein
VSTLVNVERPRHNRAGQFPVTRASSTGRCNTTWYKSFFLKGGVHEARETMEAVFGPAGRDVEPLEGWTVIT